MHLMLNNYRRHSADCKHKAKGRAFRTCNCPIWTQGTIRGQPIKRSLDTRDWKRAQDIIHQWEMRGEPERRSEVGQVCTEFVADLNARFLSKSSVKNYQKILTSENCSSLSVYAVKMGVFQIRAMDLQFLSDWRATWTDAPITQMKKLERLRVFWRWCIERGYADRNVAAGLKAPKVRTPPTLPFERDQVSNLLAKALEQGHPAEGRRLRSFILVCRYTGLRRGDTATLAVASLRGNRLLLRQEKTGEPLFTVLPDFVIEELRATPRLSERFWFWTGAGSAETVGGNFARAFRRLCQKCGIENGHLHRLRDTFAVEALNSGVPIEVVSKLLGHSSIRVTERHYAPWVKSRQEKLEAALERLWESDGMVQNWNNDRKTRITQ